MGKEKQQETLNLDIKNQHDFILVGCDTDSILFCKKDQKQFTKEEQDNLLDEINSILPELIKMDHDGYFKRTIILKTKNYILQPEDKKKKLIKKGSGLKDAKKEAGLKEFQAEVIELLLKKRKDRIFDLYNKYCLEVIQDNIDISRWSTRKNITSNVIHGTRKNETKVIKALEGTEYQEGDKFLMYYDTDNNLKLVRHYNNDHSREKLLEKIHSSLEIFGNVIDCDLIPCYSNIGNRDLLEKLK